MAILDQKYHHWKELSYRVAQPRGWAGGDLSQGSRLDLFLLYFLFSILPSTLSHSVSAPVTLAPPAAPSCCSLLLLPPSAPFCCSLLLLPPTPLLFQVPLPAMLTAGLAKSRQVWTGLARPRQASLGLSRHWQVCPCYNGPLAGWPASGLPHAAQSISEAGFVKSS